MTPSPEPSPLIYNCPRVLISKFNQTCPKRLTIFLQYDAPATSSALATLSIPSHCLAFRRIFLIHNILRSDRHVHNVRCFGVELAFCMTMVSHDFVKSNMTHAIILVGGTYPSKPSYHPTIVQNRLIVCCSGCLVVPPILPSTPSISTPSMCTR